MLWEDVDPLEALRERFGFAGVEAVDRWLAAALGSTWRIRVGGTERIVISDRNAIVWVRGDRGRLVVKIGARASDFARLGAVADLLGHVALAGVPTAAPLLANGGARRVVLDDGPRPLSVLVQPEVVGEHLDVGDLAAVHATGVEIARLHRVLAGYRSGVVDVPARGGDRSLRDRVAGCVDLEPARRVPVVRARLAELVATLPDLDRPPQLVHGDVRSANVLVRDSRVAALLDLDDVGLDDPLAELGRGAVLLATQFRAWGPAPAAARAALVEGYRSVIELGDVELGWLEAVTLANAVAMVPAGAGRDGAADPTGWGAALETMV